MYETSSTEPEAHEAPNPPQHGSIQNKESGSVITARQWLAIVAVLCLLIAMFLIMHG